MILFVSLNGTFSKNGSFSSSLKGGIMENFPGPPFFVHFTCVSFQPPNMKFIPTVIESSFKPLPIKCLEYFLFLISIPNGTLILLFSSNLWLIYASMLFYVSRDHHHFSYGKGSSKLQIFTLPQTDPAQLYCRKSLRCATNKSTKNLGCASAILSILDQQCFLSKLFT